MTIYCIYHVNASFHSTFEIKFLSFSHFIICCITYRNLPGKRPLQKLASFGSRYTGTSFYGAGCLLGRLRYRYVYIFVVSPGTSANYSLRLGTTKLTEEDSQSLEVNVISIIAHENWRDDFINDIALLQLEADVEFSDVIRPACLPQKPQAHSLDKRLESCFVLGWGSTSRTPAFQTIKLAGPYRE